ncbi:hypothetical protein J1N51_10475 [Psychrosphaera ytuae]|uniref:Uncharacterized protein n=1 Tax=Psychrosphaera ytuae TaxID=2820710 RepID=A0A975HHK1_9GAMM|nr:hypothetical protein [Psychrosphaera ytuae]QTH63162.1 hypothetical protein J1N51_10475 [Psychrosphaera ytuae]
MSNFVKVVGALFVLFLILSIMPGFYFHTESFLHWIDIGDWAGNLLGLGIAVLVFFIIGCVLFSVFAGIFVAIAMVFGALVLAGLSAVWPLVLLIAAAYFISKRSDNKPEIYR